MNLFDNSAERKIVKVGCVFEDGEVPLGDSEEAKRARQRFMDDCVARFLIGLGDVVYKIAHRQVVFVERRELEG